MGMVEVWSIDDKEATLLVSRNYDQLCGYVINGDWEENFDKVNNTVYVHYTKETRPCFYFGDCDSKGNFNRILDELRTGERKILGKNVIKYKSRAEYEKLFDKRDDEAPF